MIQQQKQTASAPLWWHKALVWFVCNYCGEKVGVVMPLNYRTTALVSLKTSWKFIFVALTAPFQLKIIITNSTEQKPYWETDSCSVSQEIFRLLWNPKGSQEPAAEYYEPV
jgi:hypothetical protein